MSLFWADHKDAQQHAKDGQPNPDGQTVRRSSSKITLHPTPITVTK